MFSVYCTEKRHMYRTLLQLSSFLEGRAKKSQAELILLLGYVNCFICMKRLFAIQITHAHNINSIRSRTVLRKSTGNFEVSMSEFGSKVPKHIQLFSLSLFLTDTDRQHGFLYLTCNVLNITGL